MTSSIKDYSEKLKQYHGKKTLKVKGKIVCVDFDGVIHSYTSGWQGIDVISDKPVDGAFQFLIDLLPDPETGMNKSEIIPVIYSARSTEYRGIAAMKTWFIKHGFPAVYIEKELLKFPDKKPAAFITIDDRAICFKGVFPSQEEINSFKAWNK